MLRLSLMNVTVEFLSTEKMLNSMLKENMLTFILESSKALILSAS